MLCVCVLVWYYTTQCYVAAKLSSLHPTYMQTNRTGDDVKRDTTDTNEGRLCGSH